MHIPDGLLSLPVAVACAALSASAVVVASSHARSSHGPRRLALTGVTAAFIFAAQMLNFPVAGGTSGHLVGGVLAAVLLGPAAAVVGMTAVLVLQCLVFGDGGILALGANVLNMAVVHPIVGFALFRAIAGRAPATSSRRIAGAAFAAWAATVCASVVCAGELALSRVVTASVVLPVMVGVHVPIGLGEALVTALVVSAVTRFLPDTARPGARGGRSTLVLGLVPSLALALFATPFACKWPDGLERVVERLGIEPARARLTFAAPLTGYSIPWFQDALWASCAAAVLGTVLVFVACLALGLWLRPSPPLLP